MVQKAAVGAKLLLKLERDGTSHRLNAAYSGVFESAGADCLMGDRMVQILRQNER